MEQINQNVESPVTFNDVNKTVTIKCSPELYDFFLKMRNKEGGMEDMNIVEFGRLWMHLKPILKSMTKENTTNVKEKACS